MKEDNSIEEKQDYLRENILEKGIDSNTFADFLVSKRGEEAADIGTWSMQDLRQIVREFLQKHESEQNQSSENEPSKKEDEKKGTKTGISEKEDDNKNIINEIQNEKEEKNKIEKKEEKEDDKIISDEKENSKKKSDKKESKKEPKQEEKKEEKIPEKENLLPPEIYGIIIPETFEIRVLETTPLSKVKNLKIKVSEPTKKEGGFFAKSYITYLITTNEPNLNVRRRYSDFTWFHETLLNLYPYVVIPPIPKKNKVATEKFNELFIIKRIRFLEKFLNWLVESPVIKNSKLFYDFLSIEKEEDFNKKKLEYQKINKPMNLREFYANKNGQVRLGVNKEKEKYFKNISENTSNNVLLLSNLNYSLKQLKLQFDIFIEKVQEVQKNWEALYVNSTRYYEDIKISNIYDKMSKIFNDWSESLIKENDLIFVDVREYFKYIKNNFRDMKENIYNVEIVKNEYYQFESFLINKKEDLFTRGEVEKWEVDPNEKANLKSLAGDKLSALFKMCAKDTDRCVMRKVYYGYYLNQIIEEYERIRNFNGILYKENQINFCKRLTEIISEFHSHIVEIVTSLISEDNIHKK